MVRLAKMAVATNVRISSINLITNLILKSNASYNLHFMQPIDQDVAIYL